MNRIHPGVEKDCDRRYDGFDIMKISLVGQQSGLPAISPAPLFFLVS